MAGSGGKASHAQMEKMLQFLKKHPSLVHGKPGGNVDRSMNHHLWQTLSEILNADGSGPAKPPLKWQKSWIDWKSNTKKKYMRIKNYMKESNDGSPCPFTLSKIEEKLVAFLYPESYEEDSLLSEQCHQSSDNDLYLAGKNGQESLIQFEPQYEYKDSMPETYAIEEVDVELDINEEEKVSLQPKKKQKIHNEDLGEYQYQEVEKNEGYETKRLELEERKLLLKERAIRDKERRTDIFDKAVRDKERRSELYDRAVRDKERRSDICDRSVREKARKTEILTRIVRDMERRTEILNRTSVAIIKALAAFTDSMSRQK